MVVGVVQAEEEEQTRRQADDAGEVATARGRSRDWKGMMDIVLPRTHVSDPLNERKRTK